MIEQYEELIENLTQQIDDVEEDNSLAPAKKRAKIASLKKQIIGYQNKIDKITEDEQKAARALEYQEKRDAERQVKIATLEQLVEERDIYFVADADVIMEYKGTGERKTAEDYNPWKVYKESGFRKRYPMLLEDNEVRVAFYKMLDAEGRSFDSYTSTFNEAPPNELNRVRKDRIILPADDEEPYHWLFDELIRSLGNNRQENMDHIEHVIAWKYSHLADYMLPCLVLYGQGSVGKNLFVERLLSTIFGNDLVAAVDSKTVSTGSFNGIIEGKAVVFIDEAIESKQDMEQLKRLVYNKSVVIDEKFLPKKTVDNTPLYITGGNSPTGAVKLAKNDSDRRWSILRVRKPFKYWVAKREYGKTDSFSLQQAEQLIRKNDHILSDRKEAARWLRHILHKWNVYDEDATPPVALHGADYKDLKGVQKTTLEEVLTAVFDDAQFKFIKLGTLYDLYKSHSRMTNPQGGIMGRNNMVAHVDTWLEENELSHIEYKVWSINVDNSVTTAMGWKNSDILTTPTYDESYYIVRKQYDPDEVTIQIEI